ncbi:acyl carrier protein [Meridianimarinicoccus aquatilis]|uniref:Acyl carrier protein n=1 Tax=Meridianimarinicoccus aquatilis TaxID=2552766 RepID=A0A4R6AXP2_9RHOB|nr:acyl carrier protein [Fluviibacterium aquatile]TDL88997.1 acyl carrier protein [Fluviibacterium aquatile]
MSDVNETALFSFLREQIAQRTRSAPETISEDMTLSDIGLQSIDAVLVCGEVEDRFNVEIDPAEIFEHDSLREFAQSVLSRMAG